MLNKVMICQVDTGEEVAREINKIVDEVNLIRVDVDKQRVNSQVQTETLSLILAKLKSEVVKRPPRKPKKASSKLVSGRKPTKGVKTPKPKKKGNVLTKTLVSLVVLAVILLSTVCLGQEQWPITYDTVSTPNQLVQLLTNRFANQSGNYFTFGPTTTAPSHSAGRIYYHTVNGLYVSDGTSWDAIDTAGGLSLDGAYDLGNTITVDGSAVTLTAGLGTVNGVLTLVQSNTGAYECLKITNAGTDPSIEIDGSGTGDDITGTGDYWTVSEVGAGTFVGLSIGSGDIALTEPGNDVGIRADESDQIEFFNASENVSLGFATSDTLEWHTDSSIATVNWGDLDAHTGLTDITGDATDFTISHTGNVTGYDLLITQSGSGDNALTLTSGGTASDAIGLVSSAGITMTSTVEASSWTQTATGTDDDLTIALASALDASLILSSAGTGADALSIFTSHANGDIKILSTDTIDIDAANGIAIDIAGASGQDYALTNTGGSIVLSATEDAADAINIDATAGGIDIDAVGEAGQDIVITNTGGSINLIQTEAVDDGLNIDTTGGIDIDSTLSIVLTSVEDTADSIVLQSTLGGIDILCDAGASGDDIDIANTGGSVNITSSEATDGAIKIQTSNATGQLLFVVADTTSDAIEIDNSGGFEMDCVDIIAIDNSGSTKDITITSALGRIILTGTESAGEAVSLVADGTAGGINIDAKTGGVDIDAVGGTINLDVSGAGIDIDLDATEGAVSIDGGQTGADAVVIIASHSGGGIDMDFGTGGYSLVGASGDMVLTAAGDVSDVITLTTTTGTGVAAIGLVATAGGVEIDAAAAKIIALDGGTVAISSKTAGAGAISLTTNIGAAETILITNTSGTNSAAINVTATAGGITIDAKDNLIITNNTNASGDDLKIVVDGDDDASIVLDSDGSGADAILISATHATTGGIAMNYKSGNMTITGSGASADFTLDADLISIDATGSSNITVAATAGSEDLTISQTGAQDAHLILSSTGTSIDSIYLQENSAGTGGGIKIHADKGIGAATGVSSIQLLSDAGGIGIKATTLTGTDAIMIEANAGGINIDGYDDVDIQVNSGATGEDLNLIQTGAQDAHILLSATGTSIDAIKIYSNGSTGAGILIHNDAGTAVTDGAASIQLLSDDGGVDLTATAATDTGAINLSAAAGGITMACVKDFALTVTSAATDDDITIATAGTADSHIIITADGSSENAFTVLAAGGNIDLTGSGASGEDFDIVSTNSALNLSSGEATTDAISIQAASGGLDLDGALSVHIASSESAVDAIYLHASAGGIDITSASGGGGEDIDIITTGGTDNHIKIISSGTSADALKLQASAGGIDIDGGAGGDVTVDTSKSILLTSTEAVSNSISLSAVGNILLATTDAAGILVNTATYEHKAKYYAISPGPTAATEIEVVGGTGLTCVGLAAGVAEIGSTEGYVEYDDAADFIRYAITLPDDFVDTGLQADLIITWDIHEQHAGGGDTNVDIDVNIYEYDGSANTTALVTDTIDVADTVGRALNGLVTLSGGIGDDAELQAGDVLIFELTGTADTDDFNLYGMKLSYRVGIQATE